MKKKKRNSEEKSRKRQIFEGDAAHSWNQVSIKAMYYRVYDP